MDISEAEHLQEIEAENRPLKQLAADFSLDKEALEASPAAYNENFDGLRCMHITRPYPANWLR